METDTGRGLVAQISNRLRPQDPGGGEVRLTSSHDETVVFPVANASRGGGGVGHIPAISQLTIYGCSNISTTLGESCENVGKIKLLEHIAATYSRKV